MHVSFVIPSYNRKMHLTDTLEALNYLEVDDSIQYDVVVVDDGSNDHTYEHIQGINKNYELKYLYLDRCADSCYARTRNHGWRNAPGDLIAFIDSDILVKKNYLKEVKKYFSVSEDILLLGNRFMIDDRIIFEDIATGEIFNKHYFKGNNYEVLDFRHLLYEISSYNANAILCPWMQVYSCNIVVKKSWLEKVGGFDENLKEWGLEDIELGYALYKAGIQNVLSSRIEVIHQNHGERNDLLVQKEKIAGYEKNIDYFLEKHPEALGMTKRIAYKFLKGEVSMNKMFYKSYVEPTILEFKDRETLPQLKEQLLELSQTNGLRIILNDYVEDTDLDIWIQLLGMTPSLILYYPMSKRLNAKEAAEFVEKERIKISSL